jgi:hypothetical protein
MLLDGTIVDADINASAAIAYSKLATLTSANIVLGSSANVATSTAVTGDVTISNAGVTAITAGVIVNADVNASAAIAGTKIAPDFGAQNIATTGSSTAATFNPTGTTAPVTGVYSPGANRLGITTNSVERVEFGTSEVVFNDDAADYDFRIEGDTNSNLFFADASAEAVGIRTATPVSELNVSVGNGGNITISNTNDAHSAGLAFGDTTSNSSGRISYDHSTNALAVATNGTQKLIVLSDGKVGIGTSSPDSALHIETTLNRVIRASTSDTGATNSLLISNGSNYHYGALGNVSGTTLIGGDVYGLGYTASAGTDFTPVLSWTANTGLVGIGSTSPGGTLDIKAAASTHPLIVQGPSSEFARIDSSGRLLVGTTSAGAGTVNAASIVGSILNQSTGRRTLSSGGTLDLDLLGTGIVGHLYVTSTLTSNAAIRTSTIFFIATRLGNNTVITSLNSANGSTNSRSFTITNPSGNIFRFTDTSSSACTVSMSFVGGI